MGKKVFVSYSHAQGEWVWNRLVPCLKAGGAEVLIDRERFEAGRSLVAQMDDLQDRADVDVLVLSPQYFESGNCMHEMELAISRDPSFAEGVVVAVERVRCALPPEIAAPNPLHVKLSDDKDGAAWKRLLDACGAHLGATAPDWLRARDQVVRLLKRHQSVNLLVKGELKWRALVCDIRENHIKDLAVVDLDRGTTESREGLVSEMLEACGLGVGVLGRKKDLPALQKAFDSARHAYNLALLHFDHVERRGYGPDLFAALRYLVTESRKLVLLLESRRPLADLLGDADPSSPDLCEIVEVKSEEA